MNAASACALFAGKGEAAPAAPRRNLADPERFASLRLSLDRPSDGRKAAPPPAPPASVATGVATAPSAATERARSKRIGVTLRLSPQRHAGLRLHAERHGRSLQDVLHDALEAWLAAEEAAKIVPLTPSRPGLRD